MKGLLFSLFFITVFISNAQVTVTAPTATVTACDAFPTAYKSIGNIVITETAATNISTGTSVTLILGAPTNFEFQTTGVTVSETGTDITSISVTSVTATSMTITMTVGATATVDAITIAGVSMRGINAVTSNATVTRTGGTSTINGNTNGKVHATLSSQIGAALPATVTASAGAQTGCTSFTANWSIGSTANVTGYEIDVSTASTFTSHVVGYPTVVGTSATTSYNVTSGLTKGVTYYYRVRAYNSSYPDCAGAYSSTITMAMANMAPDCYCTPNGSLSSTASTGIGTVTLNTLNKTANSIGGYFTFPASGSTTTTLLKGASYNISITPTGSYGSFSMGVWIDYNQNGSFADAEEFFPITMNVTGAASTGPIKVPANALSGQTGMRIWRVNNIYTDSTMSCVMNGASPGPAGGACEDYIITISDNYSHCLNTINDGDEVGLNCGGTECPACINYCGPDVNNYLYQGYSASYYINSVAINTLSNSTSYETTTGVNYAYINYTSPTTSLTQGTTYTLTVGTVGSSIVSAWIDFNRNNIFEVQEWYQVMTTGTTGSVNISVPSNAIPGPTRMRVRSRQTGSPNAKYDACSLFASTGETEDYLVTIIASCTTPTNASASGASRCGTGTVTLTASGAGAGEDYKWYNAASGGTLLQTNGSTYVTPSIGSTTTYYVTKYVVAGGCESASRTSVTATINPVATDASITTSPSTCGSINGSYVISSVTGGTPGYTYSINGGGFTSTTSYSNVAAGNYTVTVRDANNCDYTEIATVTNSAGPTDVITSQNNATCGNANGSITINSVTGGTASYQYSFNGSAYTTNTSYTNLAATTHTIIVKDANNCTYTKNVVISNTAGPSAVATTTTSATCGNDNGSITIGAVTGGTANFTFSVNGSAFSATTNYSSLVAGTHTVVVKDANACTYTTTVTVSNTPGPTAVALTPTNASCGLSNGSFVIGAVTGGTSSFTYSVSPGPAGFNSTTSFTSLTPATYTVVVRDANLCIYTSTVAIGNTPGPTNVSLSSTNATCGASNGSITIGAVAGGTASYTYSLDGGSYSATTNYTSLASATYTITVKDANNCTFQKTVVVGMSNGSTDVALSSTPSTCGNSNGTITIGAVTGGTASYTYSLNGGSYTATTSYTGLTAATYTINVKDANNCIYTENIVVSNTAGPTDVVLSPTASTCGNANGSIAIGTVTGGSSPFTYSLDGTNYNSSANISNLNSTTYTVYVKDFNNCVFTKTVSVDNTSGPSDISTSSSNASCGVSNGSITLGAVTGGTASYSYSLNGGGFSATTSYTGLAAGAYTVSVKDANNCVLNKIVAVSNTGGPTAITSNIISATCGIANGSIEITNVTGGVPAFTYAIDGGSHSSSTLFSNLNSGLHTISVLDGNNCEYTTLLSVTNIAPPFVLISNSTNVSCFNGSNGFIEVGVANGTAPYEFKINSGVYGASNQFTGLTADAYTVTVKDANNCTASTATIITQPNELMLSLNKNDITCNGSANGGINAIVNGGTPSYSYNWTPNVSSTSTANSLAPNTYSLVVTDSKGCTVSANTTIFEPTALTASATKTNVSCFGGNNGTASVTANGGTSPYQYQWSPFGGNNANAYNLTAGNYTCTVRDVRNCITTVTVSITQPSAMSLSISSTNASCGDNNGSATANVSGGTAPYIYQWSSGSQIATADTLYPGQYVVQVYDANQCNRSTTVNINTANGPAISLVSLSHVSCFGQSNGAISISVSGGATPYNYSWNNGSTNQNISGLSSSLYDVTVTDANNCSATETYIVDQPNNISFDFITVPAACGASDGSASANVTGGTGPYTYTWSSNAANQTSSVANNLSAGIYTLTVTDNNSCTYNGITTVSSAGASINIEVDTVYAAGCGTSFSGGVDITVTGGAGPYVFEWNNGSSNEDLSGVSPGTYFVTASDASGCVGTASATVLSALAGYQPQICLVTVDTTTLTNQVIWEKTVQTGIKSFKIYREVGTNIYTNIATVPFANISEYSDPVANPAIRSWRYKISAVDSCDIETPLSSPHKTIHLLQNAGLGGTVNLIWDYYDGYPYDFFFIWRGDPSTGWVKIDSLPSNLTSYTDLTPPSPDSRYMIEIIPPSPCNTTMRLASGINETQGVIVKSKSNIRTNSVVNIKENKNMNTGINVYPNPASDWLTIEIPELKGEAVITIENMLGQVIYEKKINANKQTINTSLFEPGAYLVKAKCKGEIKITKLILEK